MRQFGNICSDTATHHYPRNMSLGSFSHVDAFHDDQSARHDEQILGTSVSGGVDEHDTPCLIMNSQMRLCCYSFELN